MNRVENNLECLRLYWILRNLHAFFADEYVLKHTHTRKWGIRSDLDVCILAYEIECYKNIYEAIMRSIAAKWLKRGKDIQRFFRLLQRYNLLRLHTQ